jgi:hypothetical protein
MRLFVALLVWAAAVAGAAALSNVVAASIHTPAGQAAAAAAATSFDASKVTAADPRSLFHTANFQKALATVRSHFGAAARIDNFVLYPGYLDATVLTPTKSVDVYFNAAGAYEPTDTPADATDVFPLTRVAASAPATLSQRIATFAHVDPSHVAYMIAELDSVSHRFHWLIYMQKGYGVDYFQTRAATARLFVYRTNSSQGLEPVPGS